MRFARLFAVVIGAALVIFGVVLQLPASSASTPNDGSSTTATAVPPPAFTDTETITRDDVNADGSDDVVDSRNFAVTVDRDTELRGNQQLHVTWSGAHPTGGLVSDESSFQAAAQEEYPVVLMECRGVDSANAPTADKIDPSTCWTQTTSERYSGDTTDAFPPWRLDRYATAADTTANPGQPDPLDPLCIASQPLAARWVPFDASDGTVYEPGYIPALSGCTHPALAPEATDVEDTGAPGNTTYAVTQSDGTGSAKFVIWTADQNASLGCSATVACSLVIIPVMGVSCATPAAAGESASDDADCRSPGVDTAGDVSVHSSGLQDLTVTGDLWWTASNWRNRVSVPLGFAESSSVCSVVNNSSPVLLYGSPPLAEATQQWAPSFCTDPTKFTFRHVQTGEPAAKNLLGLGLSTPSSSDDGGSPVSSASPTASASATTSASPTASATADVGSSTGNSVLDANTASNGVEAALESDAPPSGYSQPTVQAPIAVTGFAISYIIDDSSGHEYTDLKLTPRLLAKLLTESYQDRPDLNDPALATNPVNILHDPEFQALNPDAPFGLANTDAAATLYALSGNADTMFALTSYINADPEARAWLNGAPDPWGMVVDPNYRGISLPVESWPLLDTFTSNFNGTNSCLVQAPVPYLPLVASPTSTLSAIAQALQFAAPLSTYCLINTTSAAGDTFTADPRQPPGSRFMLGLTSLGDAEYYGLDTAALQTYQVAPDPTAKFSTGVGRLFVTPNNDSLIAAARLASPDQSTGTWPIPYTAMRANPADSGAYPGTMFVYMAVPTADLPAQDAADLATFMRFAATTGQTPGFGNGQLPPGYAPMTANNGFADQINYSLAAATDVADQAGAVPDLLGPVEASFSAPPPASPTSAPPSVSATPTQATQPPSLAQTPPVVGVTQPTAQSTVTSPLPSSKPTAPVSTPAAVFTGKTVASSSTLAGSALPSVLAIGLGVLFLASGLRFRIRRRQ